MLTTMTYFQGYTVVPCVLSSKVRLIAVLLLLLVGNYRVRLCASSGIPCEYLISSWGHTNTHSRYSGLIRALNFIIKEE